MCLRTLTLSKHFILQLKFNGTYVRVGIPSASDMDFNHSYIPLIVSHLYSISSARSCLI